MIKTSRLKLRILEHSDDQVIFCGYASDPEVTRYLTFEPHSEIAQTRGFLKDVLEAHKSKECYPFAITRADNGQFLGVIDLRFERPEPEIGFVLAREFWGRGYMTEALTGLLNFAFGSLGIQRVDAYCDLENKASARVMDKAGMSCRGIIRNHILHPNRSVEPRDVYHYFMEQPA